MIPREKVEEILSAVHIEDVVGEFVTLKKRGANYIGLCPFHNEKTGSFNVNPAKNIFKCFGCGKAGDAAKFLMEHEHFTYPEALRYLAKKYNIEIQERELTADELMAQTEREKMFNVNDFADKFFTDTLWNTDEGKSVGLEYFRERGFLNPIIEKFHLGFSPSKWSAFTDHAKSNGYDVDFLEKVGFTIKKQNGEYYDRYHGRVMFPIHNLTGKVIGFGGRILFNDPEKKLAKYQNSPESEIYQKKETLYGIYFAKNAISKCDNCILVEGYFDVLRMHQIGIENVVASSGTSLTIEQIRLIKRYTNNITMLYDGDAAGLHAAIRGTDMILAEGMNVRVVVLPPEHDPDTFAKDYPTEEVQRYLKENAKDFIRFKTELLLKDAANDPIQRGDVIHNIINSIAVIPDNIFRISYVKECSLLLDMPEESLMAELNKQLRAKFRKDNGLDTQTVPEPTQPQDTQTPPVEEKQTPGFFQECELVKLLLQYGNTMLFETKKDEMGQEYTETFSVAQLIIDDLIQDEMEFIDPVNRIIFDVFNKALDEGEVPDDQYFISLSEEGVSQRSIDLLTSPYKLDNWERHEIFVSKEDDNLKKAAQSALLRYKDLVVVSRLKEIQELIKTEQDADNLMILMKKKKDLDIKRKLINEELGIVIAK